ncbi:hypothetical protein L1987_60176 [Smallanthus sonchifolius]|uniref:Uncharacterized protein n=1 Tax=Smallanthus sonchifolius TaxID=185202 RepID=A0ACB9D7D3_9ASTR|nr:hypothetical protein L1987_60176 [Smallanthus sonchifolius]
MAQLEKDQERKDAMLFGEQQIQLAAKSLDATKVQIPVASQIEEDEALALQLHEQLNKEDEERERSRRRKKPNYLEKLSNQEIYRAFTGQQGELNQ